MMPLVSVILTTRNEEKNILRCLSAIQKQTFPSEQIEIIVVDNNSQDQTKKIAARFTDRIFNVGPERSAQRNFGARQAKGKYLLFLDADMSLSEGIVAECAETCEKKGYVALYIPEKIIGKGFWIKVRNFERSFYDGTIIDCVRFIRRDAFQGIGGFEETMFAAEDWDLDRRIRAAGKTAISTNCLFHNEGEFSIRRYLQKKGYYSTGFDAYINKWGRHDAIVKKQFGFWYRYFGVFTESGKTGRLFLHPFLTGGMYILRFLVGVVYLFSPKQIQAKKKGVLILSPTFSPNVGGVETHLDDLVKELERRDYRIYVHAYSPITTPGVRYLACEQRPNVYIRRYRWFGKTLLHKLEKIPLLDFLYITPYLLLRVLFFCLFHHKKIDVIHAQGLNAAFIGLCLKIIFKKRLVISTHAVYEIKSTSKTALLAKWIFSRADKILTLSRASCKELQAMGVRQDSMDVYRYWIDLDVFKPLENKRQVRSALNIADTFTVLFVGRLTEKKGVRVLARVAQKLPFINFIFIGTGPMEEFLRGESGQKKNIVFIGRIENKALSQYYNAADIFCIPSQYEEGFGRVAMEAVACGLPVVGSNTGGIPEALDESVSILTAPTVDNLARAIEKLYKDRQLYGRLQAGCRQYAEQKFGAENADKIIASYK